MPTYIGFSTINANKPRTTNARPGSAAGTGNTLNSLVFGKKFRMLDNQLVIQDFINAINTPRTKSRTAWIWNYYLELCI